MKNKLLLAALMIAMFYASACSADFTTFKNGFVDGGGRVVDRMNKDMSHSEGQGYGMLLAQNAGDKDTFDLVFGWAKKNLQIRNDSLFAWKYEKDKDGQWRVTDTNNATDGDVLIAYALLLAHDKWGGEAYRQEADRIIRDIRTVTGVTRYGMTYLLPGQYGFDHDGYDTVNPSYVILSAYRRFAAEDDKNFWNAAVRDGRRILSYSGGKYVSMPPDWIRMTPAGPADETDKGSVFGFEAVRCLLYASWSGDLDVFKGLDGYMSMTKRIGMVPMTVDMAGNQMSLYEAPAGFYAIMAKTAEKKGDKKYAEQLKKAADEKIKSEKNNYYSLALYLLTEMK